MLSQTKENIQNVINKIQVLDYMLEALKMTHKDDSVKVEELFRRATAHKLTLIDEVLRLNSVPEIIKPEIVS